MKGARGIARTLAKIRFKELEAKRHAQQQEVLKKLNEVLIVPPIAVTVKHESTEHEGGSDGTSYGDLLFEAYLQAPGVKKTISKYEVADQMRATAKHIAGMVGAGPIASAKIVVLLHRAR